MNKRNSQTKKMYTDLWTTPVKLEGAGSGSRKRISREREKER